MAVPRWRLRFKGDEKGKNGRVVNSYISVEQLTMDVKLVGILAVGGPVRHKPKEDSHCATLESEDP